MQLYILILVMAVFLGSKLLAIPTPFAQMTIYRLLAIGVPVILTYQVAIKKKNLVIIPNSDGTRALVGYLLWWLYALLSVIWVVDIVSWFQAMFLMSLGLFVMLALYFWVTSEIQWQTLIYGVWFMICTQVIWGYHEILTGKYLFANLDKLDKYRTFDRIPSTRMPITYFANQNDYATLLLAFIAISTICYHRTQSFWLKITTILFGGAASYLIYRTDSRMALLVLLMMIGLYTIFQFNFNLKRKHWLILLVGGLMMVIGIFFLKPTLGKSIMTMLLSQQNYVLSGDGARINLWKNGLIFLAETYGLGVGAGNIETWMAQVPYYPINGLVNIHNWWIEILVAYGLVSFIIYIGVYFILVRKLWIMSKTSNHHQRQTSLGLLVFMITFIFSSITSASNMLIEWHWIIFALIISYVNIIEVRMNKECKR